MSALPTCCCPADVDQEPCPYDNMSFNELISTFKTRKELIAARRRIARSTGQNSKALQRKATRYLHRASAASSTRPTSPSTSPSTSTGKAAGRAQVKPTAHGSACCSLEAVTASALLVGPTRVEIIWEHSTTSAGHSVLTFPASFMPCFRLWGVMNDKRLRAAHPDAHISGLAGTVAAYAECTRYHFAVIAKVAI